MFFYLSDPWNATPVVDLWKELLFMVYEYMCVLLPLYKSLRKLYDLRKGGISTRLFTPPLCKRKFSGTEEYSSISYYCKLGFLGLFWHATTLRRPERSSLLPQCNYQCNCSKNQPNVLILLTILYCVIVEFLTHSY